MAAHPVVAAVRSAGEPLDRTLRITVHFHPDRVSAGGTVVEHLAREGIYRTQFETGTSNGGLTAHAGGDRAIFCFPDSAFEPTRLATADRFDLWGDVAEFDAVPLEDGWEARHGGLLDNYVEAQVHGGLGVQDVEALVLDPAHRDTPVADHAEHLGVAIEWHEGFRVHVDELAAHPRFRGPEPLRLALAVAEDGWLDPAVLGRAWATGRDDAETLKRVWHLLARFGCGW